MTGLAGMDVAGVHKRRAKLGNLLNEALATGDDRRLRAALTTGSRLPGPRLNLGLVASFAGAVGEVIRRPDVPVARLEALLDRWAALSDEEAPVSQPEVILPCAAVAAYGEAGVARGDWFDDEIAKLRHAAADSRWRVREVVAQALQRLLEADWSRTARVLLDWSTDGDLLVVRAAVAAVAEPRLLDEAKQAEMAAEIQREGVNRYGAAPAPARRTGSARALRQALGFTGSVVVAATGDFFCWRSWPCPKIRICDVSCVTT